MFKGKRLWIILALALAALLAFAACGDDDEEEEVAAGLSGSLTMINNWGGPEGEAFDAVLQPFRDANPDLDLSVEVIGFGDYPGILTTRIAAGTQPDVMVVSQLGLLKTLADGGVALPIDDLWDEWVADGWYSQALRDLASVDGIAHAGWFKANVNALMWYSPPQFDELGLEVPTTWEEFTALLGAIDAAGEEPFAVGGLDRWPLTQWVDPVLVRVAGQDAFNGLIDRTVAWDDPRVVEALEVFGDIIANYFPANTLDVGFVDAGCARAAGEAVLQNQGAFVNLFTTGACDETLVPGEDYTFFLMPKFREADPEVQFISGDMFAINSTSDNLEAAKALLSYLASPQAQLIWVDIGGYIAPNGLVSLDAYIDPNDNAAASLWPTGPEDLAVFDLDDAIGGETQEVWRDHLVELVRNPDDAASIAASMEAADEGIRGPVGGG